MAYSRPPWEFEDWPSVWVHRSLAVLEKVDEPPAFGELAKGMGGPDDQPPA